MAQESFNENICFILTWLFIEGYGSHFVKRHNSVVRYALNMEHLAVLEDD
jgi:hypothetical protein